ncbi:MAG: phosphatase [Actinobacteria bacterium]|nr:phosphatase [Actinomycetota bacterium]
MDVIESHAAGLPAIDDRWIPRPFDREELVRGLLEGRVAGPVTSHPIDNVLWKIERLCESDPDLQFGMTGLQRFTAEEVFELVAEAGGFRVDTATDGPTPIDTGLVLDACEAVGDRLAFACRRGERLVLATGHPVGLILLYMGVGRLLQQDGVQLLRPYEGVSWREGSRHHQWQVRYLNGVAMLTDKASAKHTHEAGPMSRMLRDARPELVFADHGFAGAAIEEGIDTVSIADVNDPALIVAKALGRTDVVVVMDDNVQPEAYWPCFQAIASRLP